MGLRERNSTGAFNLPTGGHNLANATVTLQRSDPFMKSSSLNITCLCQYSLRFLSFVFYRGFTIYIPIDSSHKGTVIQCSPINSRIARLDGQELGCCQDTTPLTSPAPATAYVCWIHTISILMLQISQDLPWPNQTL